jgi:hypothetical protein
MVSKSGTATRDMYSTKCPNHRHVLWTWWPCSRRAPTFPACILAPRPLPEWMSELPLGLPHSLSPSPSPPLVCARRRCRFLMAAAAMTDRCQRACRSCRWLVWPRYLEPSQGKLWPQANARWPRHARVPPLAAGELPWWPNRRPLFRPLLRPPQCSTHVARSLCPTPCTIGASRKCTLFSQCYTAVLVGLRASQHRCHRAAAVAAACSCGHGAVDCLGPSRASPRMRKGTLELVLPIATAAGDPLVGD